MDGIARTLRRSPVFCDLNGSEALLVARLCLWRRYEVGQVVFEEGSEGSSLLLIDQGQVALSRHTAAGHTVHIGRIGVGETLGEMALLDAAPRSASVTAVTLVKALEISRQAFVQLMEKHPALGSKVLSSLSTLLCIRLREVVDRVEEELLLQAEDDALLGSGVVSSDGKTLRVLPETLVDQRTESMDEAVPGGQLWRVLWGIEK